VKKTTRGDSKRSGRFEKRVDETLYLTKRKGGGILKEEVWYEGEQVVKYSLAYINRKLCAVDNGRVLGYDNNHGKHHRHFMGKSEEFHFTGYEALVRRFQEEVEELWKVNREQES
jgi:hypothetical protein